MDKQFSYNVKLAQLVEAYTINDVDLNIDTSHRATNAWLKTNNFTDKNST